MTRRKDPPLCGKRYCGDRLTRQLHDLDNETFDCNINALLSAGLAVGFDTLEEAKNAGYHERHYCFGPAMNHLPTIVDISDLSETTPEHLDFKGLTDR